MTQDFANFKYKEYQGELVRKKKLEILKKKKNDQLHGVSRNERLKMKKFHDYSDRLETLTNESFWFLWIKFLKTFVILKTFRKLIVVKIL